jgi:hypothetical protein
MTLPGDFLGRPPPGARPVVWARSADTPHTTTMPTTFDSGQAASWVASYGTNAQQYINDGLLTTAATGTGAAGGFVTGQLSGNVTRIGGRFTFGGGSTNAGAAVLAVTQTEATEAEATSGAFPPFAIHLSSGAYGWILQYIDNASALHVIANDSFTPPLANDGVTQYEMEAWLNGSNYTLRLPDGTWASGSNANIATYAGPYAFFQNHQNDPATDDVVGYTHLWAQSGTQYVLPNEQSTAAVTNTNLGTARAAVALTIDAAVHTLLTVPSGGPVLGIGTWLISATVVTEQSAASPAYVDFAVALGTASGTFVGPTGFTSGGLPQYSTTTVGVQTVVKITAPGTLILKYQSANTTGGMVVQETGISHNLGSSTGITAVRLA